MDKFVEARCLDEMIRQADWALVSFVPIDKFSPKDGRDNMFREVENFIQHASAISRFLWNDKNSEKRCSHLRAELKISPGNILENRDLRNSLVHFDERLDKWAAESVDQNFVDMNIGRIKEQIVGIRPEDYIRNYDPIDKIYSILGREFNLSDIKLAVSDIRQRCLGRKAVLSR